MKLGYLLLAVPVFFSYGSLTYAATKGLDRGYSHSHFGHDEKHEYKSYRDDNKYDFKDHISALVKNHHYKHNFFLKICKNDRDDHDYGHNGNHGHGGHGGNNGGIDNGNIDNGGVNEVPVPAAAWLFGPSLIGLLGMRRKKA